ncbi:MAG: hypothetical protein ACK5ZS_00065 [bacterium]|jgi:hypothetical protein
MNSKTAPMVSNAADQSQVKRAERKTRDKAEILRAAWQEVLATDAGRMVLWDILGECKFMQSVWHPSALIHCNAGKQEIGLIITARIAEADELMLVKMMQESHARARREAIEAQALQGNKGESDA